MEKIKRKKQWNRVSVVFTNHLVCLQVFIQHKQIKQEKNHLLRTQKMWKKIYLKKKILKQKPIHGNKLKKKEK